MKCLFRAVVLTLAVFASFSPARGQGQSPAEAHGAPQGASYGAQTPGQPGMQYNYAPGMPVNAAPAMQLNRAPEMQAGMTAAFQALTQNLQSIMTVASMLPDGTIGVAATISAAEAVTATIGTDPCLALSGMGFPVDRQQYEMLKGVDSVEKDGTHITMEKKHVQIFPLGINVEGGIVDDIKVERTIEFDAVPIGNGIVMLSNVRGIVVEARDSQHLRKHASKLSDIVIGKDAAGQTVLNARLTNPEKWWERMVTGHHNSHLGVQIRLGLYGQLEFFPQ
jgi:hypothetical protein